MSYMISCIFLVTIENLLVAVGLKGFYTRQECIAGGIRLVLSGKSLQHVLENSRSSCKSNIYVASLILEILV